MIIFESLDISERFQNPVLTIGNYDGLHIGHKAIIERVKEKALPLGGTSMLMTFNPHPLTIVRPDAFVGLISPLTLKKRLVESTGIDVMIIVPFTTEFRSVEPEEYVKDILVGRIGIKGLIVGYDFRFGAQGRGDVGLLRKLSEKYGFFFEIVEAITLHGEKIGSNRIRHMVIEGETERAIDFLGRPYMIEGRVVEGFGRGRDLGFPTVNVTTEYDLIPKTGVYSSAIMAKGQVFKAVTNVGFNPTFDGENLTIESFILGFDGDLYGEKVTLFFYRRIRDEKKFSSVDELKQRIGQDVEETRSYFREKEGY